MQQLFIESLLCQVLGYKSEKSRSSQVLALRQLTLQRRKPTLTKHDVRQWQNASFLGFPGDSDDKESACNVGDLGSIPGLGRSLGGGYGNPLQYSCLEIPHGQKSLVGCSPWGCEESDMTERLSTWPSLFLTNYIKHSFFIAFLYF